MANNGKFGPASRSVAVFTDTDSETIDDAVDYHKHMVSYLLVGGGVWTITVEHTPNGGVNWIPLFAPVNVDSSVPSDVIFLDGPFEELRIAAVKSSGSGTLRTWVKQTDDDPSARR